VAGGRLIPDYLVLQRNIGQGGWNLVYFVPVSELIRINLPVFQTVIIIVTILTVLIILSFCYLSRKVLQPALSQFSALVDSEALNRKLVETAPVGLAMVRKRDGELIFFNELAQAWIKSDESWFTRIAENKKPSIMVEFVLQDGRAIQLSYAQTFWGGEVAFLCVLNDISRLKDVERSLVEAKKAAESANKAKTLFLTTMSHEIRTPLYGIMGTLELFSLSGLNGQQSEYMKTLLLSSSSYFE
jgi:His Kinase A (phosphoacceptor) domain.